MGDYRLEADRLWLCVGDNDASTGREFLLDALQAAHRAGVKEGVVAAHIGTKCYDKGYEHIAKSLASSAHTAHAIDMPEPHRDIHGMLNRAHSAGRAEMREDAVHVCDEIQEKAFARFIKTTNSTSAGLLSEEARTAEECSEKIRALPSAREPSEEKSND